MKHKLGTTIFKFRKLFHHHQGFVVTMLLLVVALATVLRIRLLNEMRPNQAYLDEQASSVKSVNFNQKAIEQIEALRDSNVSNPGTQLPDGRDNPFSE